MKWVNHKITTFSLVLLVTHNFAGSVFAAAGSVVPDALEGHDYSSPRWKKQHRTLSHWLLGYFAVAVLCWLLIRAKLKINPFFVSPIKVFSMFSALNSEALLCFLLHAGFFMIIGCILHVFEDALSGSVPLLHPTKRTFSIAVMRTGSAMEYILSFCLLGLALFA